MYNWRKMSDLERQEALKHRKQHKLPWHNPPHLDIEGEQIYLITATCFEHRSIIGKAKERLLECEISLLELLRERLCEVYAWCVLPNHYHFLINTKEIKIIRKLLGRFHGRSSRKWNLEDGTVGRQVWHNCFERPMKSERHFYVSLNYVHHNPVFHGYVDKWTGWPFSSAPDYLEKVGKERASEIWKSHPILDYGKKWDI